MSTWSKDVVGGATKTIVKKGLSDKPAPVTSKMAGNVTMLEDINKKKLEFGKVEDGKSGLDKFLKVTLDGERITLGVCKLPSYTFCPFKAGPFCGKDGNVQQANSSWSMMVDITAEQAIEMSAFEDKFRNELAEKRDELYPPKAGAKKGMSKERAAHLTIPNDP